MEFTMRPCRSANRHLALIVGIVVFMMMHRAYSLDTETPAGPAQNMSNKERHELK